MIFQKPLVALAPAATQADILRLGLFATVLFMVPGVAVGTERHDVPKELIVHLAALGAAGIALVRARWIRPAGEDVALAVFLALGLASTAAAVNPWMAARATALACSASAVFWVVRAADGRARRRLAGAAAAAMVMAAAVALLEAYGVVPGLSSVNRAPGGTMGHRNRLAHLLVLCLPLLIIQVLVARNRALLLGWCVGLATVGAALTLSRSRAAWVAAALAVGVAVVAAAVTRRQARRTGYARRLALGTAGLLLGAVVAVAAPNQLGWYSSTPYRDSLSTLVDHRDGSGRGRVIQYRNTLHMAADHPVLGVGPGNWTIRYPSYASDRDPSYIPTDRLPTGRVPQGDWVALLAERGLPAALAALAAGLILLARCARGLHRSHGPRALRAAAGLCVGSSLAALGLLDAVLLTPAAALFAAVALGALAPHARGTRPLALPGPARGALLTTAVAALGVGALLGMAQLRATMLYGAAPTTRELARAVRVHPGDYYAHLRFAELLAEQGRCDQALPSLETARSLFPAAPFAERLQRRCRARVARAGAAAVSTTAKGGVEAAR